MKFSDELESLDQMARSPDEISGTLRLGCVSGVSIDLIPRALANIRKIHPAVQVQMQEGLSNLLAERVRRRDLDAAIITELAGSGIRNWNPCSSSRSR